MTAAGDTFTVSIAERDAFRTLEVVAWYGRLVLARSRGWLHDTHLPLGTVPTDDERRWINTHVNHVADEFGYSGELLGRWQAWRADGLKPLRVPGTR